MTQIAKLMEWNGTVETCRDGGRWFEFPKRVLRSVRFGAHDFVMGETMQIIPVRKGERARAPLAAVKRQPRPACFSAVPAECLRNVHSWFSA